MLNVKNLLKFGMQQSAVQGLITGQRSPEARFILANISAKPAPRSLIYAAFSVHRATPYGCYMSTRENRFLTPELLDIP